MRHEDNRNSRVLDAVTMVLAGFRNGTFVDYSDLCGEPVIPHLSSQGVRGLIWTPSLCSTSPGTADTSNRLVLPEFETRSEKPDPNMNSNSISWTARRCRGAIFYAPKIRFSSRGWTLFATIALSRFRKRNPATDPALLRDVGARCDRDGYPYKRSMDACLLSLQ